MRYNLLLSMLTGIIIGIILCVFYYLVLTLLLIHGPVHLSNSLIAKGNIWNIILYKGVISGFIIGLLLGLDTDPSLERGSLSNAISMTSSIVCIILFSINQWELLYNVIKDHNIGYIAFYFIVVIITVAFSMLIGMITSFIEAIREKGVYY